MLVNRCITQQQHFSASIYCIQLGPTFPRDRPVHIYNNDLFCIYVHLHKDC